MSIDPYRTIVRATHKRCHNAKLIDLDEIARNTPSAELIDDIHLNKVGSEALCDALARETCRVFNAGRAGLPATQLDGS